MTLHEVSNLYLVTFDPPVITEDGIIDYDLLQKLDKFVIRPIRERGVGFGLDAGGEEHAGHKGL